ncbi:MAG: very short patch repair endonuclease [Candidatus Acidiferrales bacterium]
MADWLSREQRSRNMASIRSKGNATTERIFLRLLRKAKIAGWRRHADLPGKPDFAFHSQKVAIFVDGCFWHGCPRCYRAPKDNRSYWRTKIIANRLRDRKAARLLRATGWRVLRIWEHSLANQKGQNLVLEKVKRTIGEEPEEIANEIVTRLGIRGS